MLKHGMLSLAITSLVASTQAQTLSVNRLYFSEQGSWISRQARVEQPNATLRLPVESLSMDQFYWQASNPQTQLVWQSPTPNHLPAIGSDVQITDQPGSWQVKAVSDSHLVLQQGQSIRYWPQSQWHLLQWTSTEDINLSLRVIQPTAQANEIFYAWQTPLITAKVGYRLADKTLYQELLLSNQSSEHYQADGYSFARSSQRPVFKAARNMMTLEASAKMVSTPSAGQSEGVPTLFSDQPLTLAAGANVWLPVAQVELNSVERKYRLSWDSRESGVQRAQTSLVLKADSLPDLPAPLMVAVFDNQLAVQNVYYQPTGNHEARLEVGQSALVSMTSQSLGNDRWQLTFSNRSKEAANIEFTATHWKSNKLLSTDLMIRVDANSSNVVDIELTTTGLKRR